MSVYRIYVKKKEDFAIEEKSLIWDIKNLLKIKTITKIIILNRYDVENITKQNFEKAIETIFCEPLIDEYFFKLPKFENILGVEFLEGQYDKRADFCEQCLQLMFCSNRPTVKTAKIYIFKGTPSKEELEKIKSYIINPIECKKASLEEKESLKFNSKACDEIEILTNFNQLTEKELKEFIKSNDLAMNFDDALMCQEYFKNTEKRPPTMTEIKVLDTYWSDHCRHTTFSTQIEKMDIKDENVLKILKEYIKIKEEIYEKETPITLMDIATIAAKKLKREGFLKNLDESEEINASSINVNISTKKGEKKALLMFKNETHNHPTEIEPFGGASTCLGGAIRDPLSGRCYVYQAMRITGAANPLCPLEKTLKGKLPQIKIVKTAALGYSSYGNQIGLSTGFVEEIYHEGYLAKRMEIGAVIGTVLKENVKRKSPSLDDDVILLGGKTGRDGCGGASGSSKSHDKSSLENCGAQVQKGNPIEERKIQRLFKIPEVTKIIKKCNDFGAGGVCVAVGELSDGVKIYLDKVPKKYDGLSATELAISESQERMAVVVSKENSNFLIEKAESENLLATKIAKITDENRMVIIYKDRKIVDISRDFLKLNGATRKTNVVVSKQQIKNINTEKDTKDDWIKHMKKLNTSSQKGLIKMFDSTIGANTVLMPYGGEYENTKAQAMVAIIPIKDNEETVSIMSYGMNPGLQKQSPFYGSIYAVIESISKIIATGGNLKNSYLTFQEYFPSIKDDEKRFGLPFSALLGALTAQLNLKIAAIGGKDSMSGSFENLDVPPTLASFAVSTANIKNIISPEFKQTDSLIVLITPEYEKEMPNFNSIKETFSLVENLISLKKAISAYAIGFGGISEAICKMCFGNKIGAKITKKIDEDMLFNPIYGSFVLELTEEIEETKNIKIIGKTTKNYTIENSTFTIDLNELEKANEETLKRVYINSMDEKTDEKTKEIKYENSKINTIKSVKIKTAKPKVLIPVFPGTNCEYDIEEAFEKEGAICESFIINNLNEKNIKESLKNFAKKITTSNIIAIPGGFSAADEPDGSAKFIVAFFKNDVVKEAINNFLTKQDGLMIGICNGFQALIKLGLFENDTIDITKNISATLTYNKIGIHQSTIARTKILTNKSPWLQFEKTDIIYKVAISHGEGRLIADKKTIEKFIENEQIASVYVDIKNEIADKYPDNPNGSYYAVEGLISKNGRIFGKMGHIERMKQNLYKNIPNINIQQIFKAGVYYFK